MAYLISQYLSKRIRSNVDTTVGWNSSTIPNHSLSTAWFSGMVVTHVVIIQNGIPETAILVTHAYVGTGTCRYPKREKQVSRYSGDGIAGTAILVTHAYVGTACLLTETREGGTERVVE